jgi:hypothetical protein
VLPMVLVVVFRVTLVRRRLTLLHPIRLRFIHFPSSFSRGVAYGDSAMA